MMNTLKLPSKKRNFDTEVDLPTSKSISNRLLIIRALSAEYFGINELSQSNDTKLMTRLLDQILSIDSSNTINKVDAQDAGTVYRFLTSLLSSVPGKHLLSGNSRMLERPIGVLVDALRSLGANIIYTNKEGFPPILIEGQELHSAKLEIQSNISSQFISALLLIAPRLPHGLQLKLNKQTASQPYIEMTIKLMQRFGIDVFHDKNIINVSHGYYRSHNIVVECDWSSAAFWYEAVAFSKNGKLLLKGLHKSKLQGDAILPQIFHHLGVETIESENGIIIQKKDSLETNFNWDFSQHPDLALPVICTCAGLGIIGKFTGLESLKIKESNRVKALESELSKLGFDFRETASNEWVLINSCKLDEAEYNFSTIKVQTYNDHRIAMSFAPFAILGKGIQIENPEVVSKSYPSFWFEFEKISSHS